MNPPKSVPNDRISDITRHPWFWPVTIFFIAIVIRLIYFFQINNDFLFQTPILDAKYYDDWAKEIVSTGDWLSKTRGVFVMSPGYSYFLALVYKLFGQHISLVVFSQFVLGSLSCVLVYLISLRINQNYPNRTKTVIPVTCPEERRKTGIHLANNILPTEKYRIFTPIITGLILAGYGISIFYEGMLIKSTLINFLNLLMLYFLVVACHPERSERSWFRQWIYFLLAGLCLGYSTHLRPNILGFVVFILFLFLLQNYSAPSFGKGRQGWIWKEFIPLILGVLIILFPVGLRNYIVGKQFVLTTAHGGMNFYTGNNPYSVGPYTPLPFARTDPEVEQDDFFVESQRRAGHSLTRDEADKVWYTETFKFIREQPGKWLTLMVRKILIFFNDYETPINLDYYFFRQEFNSILKLPWISYGWVVPFGLWGLIICWRKNYITQLLTLYLIFYFLASIIFFVVSEYRYPVVPVLAIFAAQGIGWFFEKKQKRKVLGIMFVIFCFWICNTDIYKDWFGLKTYRKANLANSYFGMGVTYDDQKLVDKAIESYKKAIQIQPQSSALINLGTLYDNLGRLEEAKQMFEFAIRSNPRSAEAYNNLGTIYFRQGNYRVAAENFQRAVLLKSSFPEAESNLREAMRRLGGH